MPPGGGYLASIFRSTDGALVSHEALKSQFAYFPNEYFFDHVDELRQREFFGSRTLVHRSALSPTVAARLVRELGLDPATFVESPDESGDQADSIFLLRHTLMNPWLSGREQGLNYLDRYCHHLAGLVRSELAMTEGADSSH